MRLCHGTTASRALSISREGLRAPAYLSPDLEGARHYASCGGELDLQDREEAFHAEHGEWPRECYDLFELHRRLYPEGDASVVVAFDFPDGTDHLLPDSGADGGMVSDTPVPAAWGAEVIDLEWDPLDDEYPAPHGHFHVPAP